MVWRVGFCSRLEVNVMWGKKKPGYRQIRLELQRYVRIWTENFNKADAELAALREVKPTPELRILAISALREEAQTQLIIAQAYLDRHEAEMRQRGLL